MYSNHNATDSKTGNWEQLKTVGKKIDNKKPGHSM